MVVGSDQYLQLGLGDDEWRHYDANPPDRPFTASDGDVSGVLALLDTVVGAQPGGTTVTGTFDFTKLGAVQLWLPDQSVETGPAARPVAFTATMDAEQWLSALTVDVPATALSPKQKRSSPSPGTGRSARRPSRPERSSRPTG